VQIFKADFIVIIKLWAEILKQLLIDAWILDKSKLNNNALSLFLMNLRLFIEVHIWNDFEKVVIKPFPHYLFRFHTHTEEIESAGILASIQRLL